MLWGSCAAVGLLRVVVPHPLLPPPALPSNNQPTLNPPPPQPTPTDTPRALGDVQFKRPNAFVITDPHCVEVTLLPAAGHRLLLLLTDGVTDVLKDDEIVRLAMGALGRPGDARAESGLPRHDDDARAAAAAVVAAAAAHALAHDNMTCVCCVWPAALSD